MDDRKIESVNICVYEDRNSDKNNCHSINDRNDGVPFYGLLMVKT